jgi:uncharacterized protein YdeI (BOF family)
MTQARHPFFTLAACALVALAAAACSSDDDDAAPSPDETPAPLTIAQARARASGETVTVEGFLTMAPGTFSSASSEQGFAIQDDSAGIYVSLPDKLEIPLDAKVRVTGKLAQVTQQTVLSTDLGSVIELTGSAAMAAKDVTTGGVNESVEGLLVHLSGRVTKTVEDDQPYGFKVYVNDGSGEVQIFVHIVGGAPVVDLTPLQIDQTIEVTGLAAQYETTYEVAPRKAADVVQFIK